MRPHVHPWFAAIAELQWGRGLGAAEWFTVTVVAIVALLCFNGAAA